MHDRLGAKIFVLVCVRQGAKTQKQKPKIATKRRKATLFNLKKQQTNETGILTVVSTPALLAIFGFVSALMCQRLIYFVEIIFIYCV